MRGHAISNLPFGGCEGLICSLGTDRLGPTLKAVADDIAGIDEIFAFHVADEEAPEQLISDGRPGASMRATHYAQSYFRFDPLFPCYRAALPIVSGYRLVADEISQANYRNECYDAPQFREKLSFVGRCPSGRVVINFYRRRGRESIVLSALQPLAELAVPTLAKHHEITAAHSLPLCERVEHKLACQYERLTERERSVCARTITGMTAEAIALDLDISISTVLTYRRRAYGRYSMTNANQFLARLIP